MEKFKCKVCGDHDYNWFGTDHDICCDCREFASEDDEVISDTNARCPKCRKSSNLTDYEIHGEDDLEVSCDHCGHEFMVQVSISVHYTSPAIETAGGK